MIGFEKFFTKLEQYNFTIDENSPTEVEISVDPEMLGRIFENLLAEIDPDSGISDRKGTGSFYTPREIVNYMVDESLLIYLKSKLESLRIPASKQNSQNIFVKPTQGDFLSEQNTLGFSAASEKSQNNKEVERLEKDLRDLFSYSKDTHNFSDKEVNELVKAIDECKILDPACGSGAFPMGVLHRLVFLLTKLDPNAEKWKARQKENALEETRKAFDEGNPEQREQRLLEINSAFEKDSSDFGRKLFLIENCIYGVDIQSIAAEISKLRCFLTLIVDEDVNDDLKHNRGVKPLPNLEFKFVTADALLKLPEAIVQADLFNTEDKTQLEKLEELRHKYIQSSGEQKEKVKKDFEDIQDEIFRNQTKNSSRQNQRALALSCWKPFSHEKTGWFDSLWMFGVKEFDIVIGNPPYGATFSADKKAYFLKNFKHQDYQLDSYLLFTERSFDLVKKYGIYFFYYSKYLVNQPKTEKN